MRDRVDADGFIFVRRKGRGGKDVTPRNFSCGQGAADVCVPFDPKQEESVDDSLIEKSSKKIKASLEALEVEGAKQEESIRSVVARCVAGALNAIGFEVVVERDQLRFIRDRQPVVRQLVYGLGSVSKSPVACQQLALSLLLKDLFGEVCVAVEYFDPVFSPRDRVLLKKLGASRVEKIDERLKSGLRPTDELLLFFLPHCPHEVTESVLRLCLKQRDVSVLILGNDPTRFTETCEDLSGLLAETKTFPLGVASRSPHFLAFNDTSAYAFPASLEQA